MGKLDSHMQKKNRKLDQYLTPYTEVNAKRIQDLNVRPETVKVLELIIGSIISELTLAISLGMCRQARKTKAK